MNPRGVNGAHSPAGNGAPATTERGGKGGGGGFAAVLSQLGVNTKTAGEDASGGKDRRPPTPAPQAAHAAATIPAGQILPGQITRLPVEAKADAAPASALSVARPVQSPPSMSNNAAPSRFEAPRLVAQNRSQAAVAADIRLEIPASDVTTASKHAKVLTDASRMSDAPAARKSGATNLTTTADRLVIQVPVSTARAATVSPVAYTQGAAQPEQKLSATVAQRQPAVVTTATLPAAPAAITTTTQTPSTAKKADATEA